MLATLIQAQAKSIRAGPKGVVGPATIACLATRTNLRIR